MVGRWRIRHKLIFGMTLVLAVMALLLAGTYKGLSAYRANMRAIDTKLVELEKADELRASIKQLAVPGPSVRTQAADLQTKIEAAREAWAKYISLLLFTTQQSPPALEPTEWVQAKALEEQFQQLAEKLGQAIEGINVITPGGNPPDLLGDQQPVRGVIDTLVQTSADLIDAIHFELHRRTQISRSGSKTSMILVITTSVLASLLMVSLLRFFYHWVVHPIRELEQGVGRVAKGDFDYRIEINSGDEIQELAQAFNDMSGRLRDMYRDLAQQVNERSRQLVRSERLAGVGFLAAGVAHEINNPLASIAFCSEALERRLGDLFDRPLSPLATGGRGIGGEGAAALSPLATGGRGVGGEGAAFDKQERDIVQKYLKMIQEEAFRCKEITQKLLAFSRGGERKREATDLGELIQGVLDMVQHLQNCKGKDLVFEAAEPVTAWVNGQEIKQVLLNLAVNALDSMDEGGCLTVTQGLKDGMVELRFHDTGCGMTPEVLENIFEPFFTRSRTGKGTGLGLSISHRIVSAHGGEIEASSAGPDQGSTFVVRLPLEPSADAHGESPVDLDPEVEFLKLTRAQDQRKAA